MNTLEICLLVVTILAGITSIYSNYQWRKWMGSFHRLGRVIIRDPNIRTDSKIWITLQEELGRRKD